MAAPFPDLSARQLSAVVAVAEYRSFIAAASAARISQPALTRLIKQVETELGVLLFVRNTRHVSVTDAGKEFAAHAERILNELNFSVSNIRDKAREPRGQVVVSSVLSLANAVLPALIANYSRRFPGVEIHLREGLHRVVRDEVRGGLADFGVGYVDDLPDAFITETLAKETLYVVLPRDHRLARRKPLELRMLQDSSLVSFPSESHTRRAIDASAALQGLALRYLMTTNRLATLYDLVRNRVGVAVVPFSERPPDSDPDLVSRPLIGQRLISNLGILRLRARELSPAAAELLREVGDWMVTLRHDRRKRNAGSKSN